MLGESALQSLTGQCLKCLVDLGGVRAATLCEVRLAAATTAKNLGSATDQITSLDALLACRFVGCHGDHGLAVLVHAGKSHHDRSIFAELAAHVEHGLAQVPEGRHVFLQMTVEENLEMGAFSLKDQSDLKKDLDMVYGLFPRLKERRNQKAGTLSGGEQQMLAMGRALMSHPKTILMDEPSMGLSPKLVKEIFSIIRKLHEQGITILLVEQNAKMALSIADRAYVLETGRITMEGDAKELLNNEQVRKAYLGA